MKIRFATMEDINAIAHINYTSWQETYRGIIDDNFLDSLNVDGYKIKWQSFLSNITANRFMLVAENEDGGVIGYCAAGKVIKGLGNFEAEIYALYLLKQYQGKGIGKDLFAKSINVLEDRGFRSCCLFVLKGNPSANFYLSFKPDVEELITVKLGEKKYPELAMGWSDLKMFNSRSV